MPPCQAANTDFFKENYMLYYWQINNNYEDDSVFLDHTGILNEDAIRKAIIESQVSTVLYSKDIPNDTIISLKKSIPEVIFKRSYDPRIYVRSLREECYEVQNPVLDLSRKVTEEFYAKKQKLKNDSVSAEKIAETTMLHPGKRILWSCCNPSSVMLDFFEEITFKNQLPISNVVLSSGKLSVMSASGSPKEAPCTESISGRR